MSLTATFHFTFNTALQHRSCKSSPQPLHAFLWGQGITSSPHLPAHFILGLFQFFKTFFLTSRLLSRKSQWLHKKTFPPLEQNGAWVRITSRLHWQETCSSALNNKASYSSYVRRNAEISKLKRGKLCKDVFQKLGSSVFLFCHLLRVVFVPASKTTATPPGIRLYSRQVKEGENQEDGQVPI